MCAGLWRRASEHKTSARFPCWRCGLFAEVCGTGRVKQSCFPRDMFGFADKPGAAASCCVSLKAGGSPGGLHSLLFLPSLSSSLFPGRFSLQPTIYLYIFGYLYSSPPPFLPVFPRAEILSRPSDVRTTQTLLLCHRGEDREGKALDGLFICSLYLPLINWVTLE